ncbi:MAG: mevalonate kinase [Candidatus Levybacteria bacterium]|nr:mevalonate kinase [Candidatus Levybacteria bacterium]
MNKITVSAPGKLMLLGEHAVVYNHPCLVTAVDQRMRATVETLPRLEFQLEAEDVKVTGYKKPFSELGVGDIPKGAKFVEIAVKNLLERSRNKFGTTWKTGIRVITKSEFSSQFGFGSSSASTVCTIKAISELLKLKLSNKEIFDIAFKTVLDIQGKGSGFDVAAAVYGGTLYFVTGGKVIEPLEISTLPLLVGYSGIKADTVTLINKVKEAFKGKEKRLEEIYKQIASLVEKARTALLIKDWKEFGKLMNQNQEYLRELGVSIPKLDDMINISLSKGAYGAKLSGAGGGDCMIVVCPKDKELLVKAGISQVGGQVIGVKTNAEGVKVEK